VYFGGMEHTTLHLLYSRFWNLFLYDQDLVTVKEPFILRKPHGIVLAADGEKMSKSRGNVVNPDMVVKKFGVDTLRMYELFLGPYETQVSWNNQGIIGVKRFLDRVWEWIARFQISDLRFKNENQTSEKAERALHRLIKKITEDIENFRFNTAVAAFMEFHNEVKAEPVDIKFVKTFLILLYPFAPHLCEELNERLGNKKSLQLEQWPEYNASKIVEANVEIVVQINGKVKGRVQVPAHSSQDFVQNQAMGLPAVKAVLPQGGVKRAIFVKDRLINLVI
jgi:leucyl-tRNA synthetase